MRISVSQSSARQRPSPVSLFDPSPRWASAQHRRVNEREHLQDRLRHLEEDEPGRSHLEQTFVNPIIDTLNAHPPPPPPPVPPWRFDQSPSYAPTLLGEPPGTVWPTPLHGSSPGDRVSPRDNLGTLITTASGRSRFIGASAGSQWQRLVGWVPSVYSASGNSSLVVWRMGFEYDVSRSHVRPTILPSSPQERPVRPRPPPRPTTTRPTNTSTASPIPPPPRHTPTKPNTSPSYPQRPKPSSSSIATTATSHGTRRRSCAPNSTRSSTRCTPTSITSRGTCWWRTRS